MDVSPKDLKLAPYNRNVLRTVSGWDMFEFSGLDTHTHTHHGPLFQARLMASTPLGSVQDQMGSKQKPFWRSSSRAVEAGWLWCKELNILYIYTVPKVWACFSMHDSDPQAECWSRTRVGTSSQEKPCGFQRSVVWLVDLLGPRRQYVHPNTLRDPTCRR